jgi:xylulokinase
MSADTEAEAEEIRRALGGGEGVTALSGSDSPLRFSGAVLRRRAKRFPSLYSGTWRVHLISSFLAGVLAGEPDSPIDWGNGSGTSLMDWSGRVWAPRLLAAVGEGLPGGKAALVAKLPPLADPLAIVGPIAAYFRERYGIPEGCVIIAGSGDNPQSKVLAEGTLLSLGTSFVIMTEGSRPHLSANAMYDGLGRPFLFGCRTNGALAWEAVRTAHGLKPDDFAASDRALAGSAPGSVLRIFQSERESFPFSPILDLGGRPGFAEDYAGVVDSSLGLLALGSAPFSTAGGDIAVTGGAAASREVLKRIAAIWGRRVVPIADAGAAAGAAVAAACALVDGADREQKRAELAVEARRGAARPGTAVEPDPAAVRACRGKGGYLERLSEAFRGAGGSL